MASLRSTEEYQRYESYKANGGLDNGCRLCEREALRDFEHWKIIQNEFPYDVLAKVHHMIVPRRHTTESGLSEAERTELLAIKDDYIHKTYEFLMEATHLTRSIPEHFHLHLVVVKD